jgi:hypothetical protein
LNIEKYQQVGMRCITFAPLLAGLLLALSLEGCSSNSTTRIDVRDNSVSVRELRMAYNFDHQKETAFLHTGNAIEFGITNTSGRADQSLTSGQLPIILNQVVFNAPQQIKNEFDFAFYDLAWRYRNFFEEKFGMELSVGAGYSLIDLKSSSTTQIASQRFESSGARIEYGLLYLLSPSSSVQARAKFYWAPLQYTAVDSIARLELVYAKTFLKNFNLRAGLSRWQVSGHDDRSFFDSNQSVYRPSRSDFRLDFFGPTIALNLEF